MKKFFLTGLALLIVSGLVFTSCSEEENINTDHNQHLSNQNISRLSSDYGSLEYKNKTVLINKDDFSMFQNDSLKYDFHYEGEMDYNFEQTSEEVKISNIDNNEEFFKIQNVVIEDDRIVFDVLTSDNQLYENINYYADSVTLTEARACAWCWLIGPVVDAAVAIFSESDCQTAIKACLQAGGLPSTTITNGLFGSSCSVTCKPKK